MDNFFGIGIMELVFIMILALVVLGPERLPGAAREVAKIIAQIRSLSSEFTSQFSEELKMLDEINPTKLANNLIKEATDPKAKPLASSPSRQKAPTAVPPSTQTGAAQARPEAVEEEEEARTILPPEAAVNGHRDDDLPKSSEANPVDSGEKSG
ncbi:MAG: twin-arginine translocase subunit TatB [Caldilineaceae bacterium]|nr:twin-arginine translocase subunit TatB [Caldilineaceae bacterium]